MQVTVSGYLATVNVKVHGFGTQERITWKNLSHIINIQVTFEIESVFDC